MYKGIWHIPTLFACYLAFFFVKPGQANSSLVRTPVGPLVLVVVSHIIAAPASTWHSMSATKLKTDNPMKTKARSCHTAYLQPPSTEDSSMIEGDTKFANAEELKEWLLGQGVDEDDVVEAVDRLFAMKFNRPSRLFGITVRRSEEAHLH